MSRCRQGCAPSEGWKEESLPLLASVGCWHSLFFLGLWQHHSSLYFSLLMPMPLCGCVQGSLLFLGWRDCTTWLVVASQVALVVKNLPAIAGDIRDLGSTPGQKDPLEEGMATHSSVLAWRIPWTEEPGGLQSMGLQRVRHDWSNLAHNIMLLLPVLKLYKHGECFSYTIAVFWVIIIDNVAFTFQLIQCLLRAVAGQTWCSVMEAQRWERLIFFPGSTYSPATEKMFFSFLLKICAY